jgi:N-acetylglutamate synthase-like GNAT family acetyltransferase
LPERLQNATEQTNMSPQALHIRRATVDDRDPLKNLWASMRLPPDELEKHLTEFQVVENSEGEVVGAIGIQFSENHALLHSEGYSDFGVADAARQLFWERIQTLSAHNGIFRIWTQERSPFWKNYGFQPPTAEIRDRLPGEWKNEFDGGWLTLQLKNEEVITAAMEKGFASFKDSEKKHAAQISEKARLIKTIVTVVGFAIGIISIGIAIYLFAHRNPFR